MSAIRILAAVCGAIIVATLVFTLINYTATDTSTPTTEPTAAPSDVRTLDGTFTAEFGPPAGTELKPNQELAKFTWASRSVCTGDRCTATVAFLSPPKGLPLGGVLVFDFVDGGWVSVQEKPGVCDRGADGKIDTTDWLIFTLRPQPDGTLSGTFRDVATRGGCNLEQSLTVFPAARTQAPSLLSDPAAQPPRVTSPAETLRGRYTRTQTLRGSDQVFEPTTFVGATYCLRSGDRCITNMRVPDSTGLMVMTFDRGAWTEMQLPTPITCPAGAGSITSELTYPLVPPAPNPIFALSGSLHQTYAGVCTGQQDYDMLLKRIGD